MTPKSLTIVRETLQSYADRGMFRGFSEVGTQRGTTEFKILCVPITEEPFALYFTPRTRTLAFKRLLREMPARSALYAGLKVFVRDRSSPELIEHRRIDSGRVEVKCTNRAGNVSLTLTVKKNAYEYAVRKGMNLVCEIFMELLFEPEFVEYAAAHFNIPDE